MHGLDSYRKSVVPASPSLPFLSATDFPRLSDNRRMSAFAFDRERVKAALKSSPWTNDAFAKEVGLTHVSALYKILKGERDVKADEAARIYSTLRLAPEGAVSVHVVPIIGLAAAGQWREAIEMPLGRMMVPSSIAGARSFGVEVKGDSMDQLIEDGGWIVVDPDDKVLSPGKCYLLQNGEHEVTVKQYQKNPPRFEPVSSNPDHDGFLVSDCDPVILGRVVWKGSPV
jgi:repressor LexA